jgi:hypothetical protein
MSLEGRIERLEERYPDRPPMIFLCMSGDGPPLSEEDEERLIHEAIQRDPGRPLYYIVVPRPDQGQDTGS